LVPRLLVAANHSWLSHESPITYVDLDDPEREAAARVEDAAAVTD